MYELTNKYVNGVYNGYNGTKIFSVTIPKEKNIITRYFVVAKQQLYVSKNKQFSGILASSGSNYFQSINPSSSTKKQVAITYLACNVIKSFARRNQ